VALHHQRLEGLATQLTQVPGVVGVMLGGSRARGDHLPESDVDLGLYYRPALDVTALAHLAREVAGAQARVSLPGAWGPWVDGGGWLRIAGTAVDWIYRDLDRVHASWEQAREGRFQWHAQAGHPLGVPDFAYAGEVALGVVLADPEGELTELTEATRTYPPLLGEALVAGLWEASFLIDGAQGGVAWRHHLRGGLPVPHRRRVRARAPWPRRALADPREGRGRLRCPVSRRAARLRVPGARDPRPAGHAPPRAHRRLGRRR